MSPYASELARARLDALRALIDALNEAESPDEKRRCAVAIFNAPDPFDLDDEIEFKSDDDTNDEDDNIEIERGPSVSEPVESPSSSASPITSPPTHEMDERSPSSSDVHEERDAVENTEDDPFSHLPTAQHHAFAHPT